MTRHLIYALLVLGALGLLFCSRDLPKGEVTQAYLNLKPEVKYVGMQMCRSCHANIHETFIHTGMGRSFDHAKPTKSDASYGSHALVYDEQSDFYYYPYFEKDTMFIHEFRLSGTDTVHQRTERISYIIGSGQHTNSHLLDINGYVYQAPITFYTHEGRWDMAPGFRQKENERFDRFLTSECLTCHNHYPKQIEGSLNKFANMPTGIECERCHGPGEVHVLEKLAGNIVDTSQQIDYTIVNPRDLPRDEQMDLCQRCHLQGIAVLEEGKSFYDFKPGMRLQEVMNVFLPRYTDSHEKFIMASQADRLRLSNCYKLSDMTCLTCHNPHQSIEATAQAQYNNACQSCHAKAEQKSCSAAEAERLAQGNDCAGCHMPPSGSIDIPHVNITDHYIARDNIRGKRKPSVTPTAKRQFLGLKMLTKENPTPLDMARGYIALYDKYVDSPIMLDSAQYYLQQSGGSDEAKAITLVHYHFARADYKAILAVAKNDWPVLLEDAWTAYRIGEAFYQNGAFAQAKTYFAAAVDGMPYNLEFREKLGVSLIQLKALPQAMKALKWVLDENPKRPVALCNLGFAYVLQNQFEQGEALYDQAIALDPDYEQALMNKAAIRLLYKDEPAARTLFDRILNLNPNNEQAKYMRAQLTIR
ncbi:MAG: tetratricopeptide repeat protein [Bacteroidota bacterium]